MNQIAWTKTTNKQTALVSIQLNKLIISSWKLPIWVWEFVKLCGEQQIYLNAKIKAYLKFQQVLICWFHGTVTWRTVTSFSILKLKGTSMFLPINFNHKIHRADSPVLLIVTNVTDQIYQYFLKSERILLQRKYS